MKVSRKRKNIVVLDNTIGKVNRTTRMFVSREEVRRKQAGLASVGVIVFLAVMLALFGSISVFTDIVRPEINNPLPGVSEDAAKYDDSDALTLAVIREDDERVPVKLMLVRFEPSEERIYVAGVPLNTVAGEKTLAQHFSAGGTAALADALEELVDCDEVFTLRYNYYQTRKLINYFDGVKITLDYGITYQSPDGTKNVNVVAGTRVYTGWEIARLLDYPDWKGGEEEHLHMFAYVLTQFLDQNFRNFNETKLEKFFAHVCAYSDNDITTNAFHSASEGMIYLSQLEVGERAVLIEPKPVTDSDGNYVYEDKALLLLRAAFGDRDVDSD